MSTLEKSMRRLVDLCELSESAARREGIVDVKIKAQAEALHEAVLTALSRVSGEVHPSAAAWRVWWNDRTRRGKFLRSRGF